MYHDGNGIGFSSRIVLMPEHKLCIFLITNHRSLTKNLTSSKASNMLKGLSTEILKNFIPKSSSGAPYVKTLINTVPDLKRYEGHYQGTQISNNDFLKMEALMNYVDVVDEGTGSLKIGSNSYVEVEPMLLQSIEYPSFFVVFTEDENHKVKYLSFGGTGSYKKVLMVSKCHFS